MPVSDPSAANVAQPRSIEDRPCTCTAAAWVAHRPVARNSKLLRQPAKALAMLKRILAGVVLSLMLTGGAAAGPLEEGVAAYQRGDYATALRLWRPLAEQGDGLAQSNLGVAYDEGRGVGQDDAEAVKWYRLAAEQGYAGAQYNLASMYAEGEGVPQDDAEALKWFRLAAKQGHARAQYDLGVMYAKGQGVGQDDAEAVKWYRLAAEQGNAAAQYNLGIRYAKGRGVPQDYVQALMWFNLAASRFPASEAKSRDQAVENRDIAASKMTPAQIAEAQKLAREWKPK